MKIQASWLLLTCAVSGITAGPAFGDNPDKIQVVAAGSAPFVVQGDHGPTGASVEVWADVAQALDLDFDLRMAPTVEVALEAVAEGRAQVAVGPLSITSVRSATVAFTQPYYRAPLGMASHPRGAVWSRIAPFLSRAFLVGVVGLMVVLALVGGLIWTLEHRRNPEQFDSDPVRGFGQGLWFALVTMTTVGYGDKVPVTPGGRVVAGIWMVLAMLTASSLTAGIATALTLFQLGNAELETLQDVRRLPVAVLEGTRAGRLARGAGASVRTVGDLDEAFDLLRTGDVEAVVADLPVLEYALARRDERKGVAVVPVPGSGENYGFAVRPRDPIDHALDREILKRVESGHVQRVLQSWDQPRSP